MQVKNMPPTTRFTRTQKTPRIIPMRAKSGMQQSPGRISGMTYFSFSIHGLPKIEYYERQVAQKSI